MNLSDYLRGEGALSISRLREMIGAKDDNQIRQWQHGYAGRVPSPIYAAAIERATEGAVTRQDLRPHDWWLIWPELDDGRVPSVPGETA